MSQPRRRLTMLASPLTAFIAAAHGDGDRRPRVQLGVVGGPPDGGSAWVARPRTAGIGIVRGPVGQRDVGGELRRDVGVQACPRRRAGGRQLGVQAFLGLAHLVLGTRGEAA